MGIEILTDQEIAYIMSQHIEFSNYEIGEDNEGQLIIYTGLYAVPPATNEMLNISRGWVKLNKNPVPQGVRAE